jgi:hypothetical protein
MSTTATDSLSNEDIPITVPVTEAKQEGNPSQPREDATPGEPPEQEYPSGPKFWLMGFALCLGGFLVSLVSHLPSLITACFSKMKSTHSSFLLYRIAQLLPRRFLLFRMNSTHLGTLAGTAVCTFWPCVCPSFPLSKSMIDTRSDGPTVLRWPFSWPARRFAVQQLALPH